MVDIICAKMTAERKQYENILENADLKTREDAIKFAEALTKIIWDHQMLGLVYEYYDENVAYKGANGKKLTKLDDIVLEFLALQAAFPDMRVHITETFATGNAEEGFNVYQRSYCDGTNKGTSLFGPPTGNKLNENNSLGQTVYLIKKVQGKWKVVTEYSLRSPNAIEKLLKNEIQSL